MNKLSNHVLAMIEDSQRKAEREGLCSPAREADINKAMGMGRGEQTDVAGEQDVARAGEMLVGNMDVNVFDMDNDDGDEDWMGGRLW